MAEVFIAHDSEDIAFAELVEVRLTKAGHEARLDSGIPAAGEAWQDKLDEAISKADLMVVIMSPEARASARVTYEWAFALGAGLGVIPVVLKPTPFHPRLEVLNRLDFTDRQRPWEAFLQEIEKAAGPTTTILVPPDAHPTIKSAVAALDSLDLKDQVDGVQSLAKMDHKDAREALAEALEHPVRTVRMTAAFKYPDRKEPKRIPGLIDCYRNMNSLRQWSELMGFYFADLRLSFFPVDQIKSMGPPAAQYLLKALQDPYYKDKARALAACALGGIGETQAVGPLIGLLSDYFMPARMDAAQALGRIGEKTAVPYLIEALGDEKDQVRAAAARALGRIGHNAVAELIAALEDDSVWVRAAAAEALGESRTRPAVPHLLDHLHNDSFSVRAAAALALGRIGDPAALTPLVEAFQDNGEKMDVRRAAAQALGLHGEQRAEDALLTYLRDRQKKQNREGNALDFAVAEALLKLRGKDAIELVGNVLGWFRSGAPPVRIVALLGAYGDVAVPALAGLLAHRSLGESSAKILNEIGTPRAQSALEQWRRSR